MEVTLLVADAATDNKDGTFSALRAGITEVFGPVGKPVQFGFAIILRVWFEASESTKHTASISIRNEDGKKTGPEMNVEFTPHQDGAGGVPIVMRINGALPHGRYEVNAVVDGQRRAVWPLLFRAPKADEGS